MIIIYRCENTTLAEFLRFNGITYDVEGRDRDGATFYGYYKTEELEDYLKEFYGL